MRALCLASLFKWCVSTTIFFPACEVVNRLSESHRLQLNLYFHWFYRILCSQTDQAYVTDADGLYMHNTFFFVCDVSGHEVAVGSSSVTAALVYLLIWSDLVFPERSRFCDRCWWTFYLFFICITGDMVLLWYWHGMFRPNLVFLIAMFVTSWRFQFMHIFSAYNEDFTKKTSL